MRERKTNQIKKGLATGLAILLVLALVLSMVAPFFSAVLYAAPIPSTVSVAAIPSDEVSSYEKMPVEFGNENFQIQGDIGFDNKYMLEKRTPFKFIVTNNGDDFKGEFQLRVYLYDSMNGYSNEYTVYYVPLELPSNATKEISMDVNIFSIRKYFTISMVNDSGNMVTQQNFSAEARDPFSIWTGILSENPSELVYLKDDGKQVTQSSGRAYGTEMYNTVFFTKNSFPDNEEVMKNFRMLIINDFNTETLSEEQIKALKNWVYAGGLLVLGTGVNADKVLGGLEELAVFRATSTVDTAFVRDIETLVNVSDANMEGEKICIEEDVYTSYLHLGSGGIVLHKYDLGKNISFHSADFIGFLRTLYASFDPYRFDVTQSYFYNETQRDYYTFETVSRRQPVVIDNAIGLIYTLILIYMFAIGPVLYIILKKKDKREKGWVIIPAVSVVVMVIVYLLGTNSYYRNSIFRSVYYIDAKCGSPVASANIYASVTSGEKGDLKFTTDADIKVDVTGVNANYYYRYDNEGTEKCVLKINATGSPEITYFGAESWSSNSFTATKTIDLGGSINADITVKGDNLVGTITNDTSFDWEDAVLNFGNQFVYVGYISAGAQVNIFNEINNQQYLGSGGYYYMYDQMLRDIFGTDYFTYGINFFENNIERKNRYTKNNRYELIAGSFRNSMISTSVNLDWMQETGEYAFDGKLYAFNNTESMIEEDKYLNGKKMKEQQETMIVLNIPLHIDTATTFTLPFGMINPSTVYGGNGEQIDMYSDGYMYSYTDQSFIAEFILPQNVKIENFKIESFEIEWNSYGHLISGQIFNFETNEWEETNFGVYRDTAPYINDDGMLMVQGYFDSKEAETPRISLKGGVQ